MDRDRPAQQPHLPAQRDAATQPPASFPPVTMSDGQVGHPQQAPPAVRGNPAVPVPPAGRRQVSNGQHPPAPTMAGRPRYFPSTFTWLRVGMGRSWRGVLGALVGTWFYVPFALAMSVLSAVVLGIVGFFGGFFFQQQHVPAAVTSLPLLGPAVEAFLPASGGVLGGLIGVLLGLLLGFTGALAVFWVVVFSDDPVAGLGRLIGVAVAGLLVGVGYTLYRVMCESMILRLSGARRLSRRERELLLPIAQDCARRLRLANFPPILMDDSRQPSAIAYTRHIVLSRGLLEEFEYDREVIAGVLCHELVHWRNGDPISAAFVRGTALPLYLAYAAAGWLSERGADRGHYRLASALAWLVLWPALLTVRFLIILLQAIDARRAEYRADQGAVLAGYRDGLRRALEQLLHSFESGRNGWDRAICAAHPPDEFRLERLEDAQHRYPFTELDGPLPTPGGGSLRQD